MPEVNLQGSLTPGVVVSEECQSDRDYSLTYIIAVPAVPAVPENTRGSTGLPRRVLPSLFLVLSFGMSEVRPIG